MRSKLIDLTFYKKWSYRDCIINLFLLLVISISFNYESLLIVPALISLLGLFIPRLQSSTYYWSILFLSQLVYLISHWALIDDHYFLIASMTLAITLSNLYQNNYREVLEKSLSYCTATVMLLAVFYKIYQYPEYGSGHFLSFIEVVDHRFHWLVQLLGEDPHSLQKGIILTLKSMSTYPPSQIQINPNFSSNFIFLNQIIEILIIALEAFVGIIFLSPNARKAKVNSLILFICCVYTVAPVLGFAWGFGLVALSLSLEKLPSIYSKLVLSSMFYAFINLILTNKKLEIIGLIFE